MKKNNSIFLCYYRAIAHLISHRSNPKAGAADILPVPDPGAGEGVPLQPLSHSQEEDRDSPCPLPLRETDQNLVSEPQDEVEERQQGGTGVDPRGKGR